MDVITGRDLGDECDMCTHSDFMRRLVLDPLPATVTTMKGTKIYPPVNGALYIIKRKGEPAQQAWCMEDALEVARHLEGAMQ